MIRKGAKEVFAESFRELAKNRPTDRITVGDIVSNSGYSSSTFYRHFRDKYDLIAWDYAGNVKSILERGEAKNRTWKDSLLGGAVYYDEHREYLSNLLSHTSGYDAFLRNMTEINIRQLSEVVKEAVGTDELSDEIIMYIHLYCYGTVMLSCEWIMGMVTALPEQIAEVYENSIPDPLRKFLL